MQNTGNSSCWGIARVYVDELGFVFVGAGRVRLYSARFPSAALLPYTMSKKADFPEKVLLYL